VIPEGKFLKKGWASRDEQRERRKAYRQRIKAKLRRLARLRLDYN